MVFKRVFGFVLLGMSVTFFALGASYLLSEGLPPSRESRCFEGFSVEDDLLVLKYCNRHQQELYFFDEGKTVK